MWKEADCINGILDPTCLPLLVAGGGGGAQAPAMDFIGDDGHAEHSGGNSIGYGGEGGQAGDGGYSANANM